MFPMELNENFDFSKTCRLCLSQTNEFTSIFDISSYEVEYIIIISQCTDLMIYENDELPKIICTECVQCLNNFYQFRKLVKNSQFRLINFLNKFRNNLNPDVIVNIDNIKQENLDIIDCSEKPTSCSRSESDPLSFQENPQFESNIVIVKEELEIDENETFIEPTFVISNYEENAERIGLDIVKTIYHCKSCPQTFTKKKYLKKHEKLHIKTNQYTLPTNKSTSSSNFQRFKESKKSGRRFHCKDCGKSYKNLYTLRYHRKVHTGEKLICKHCYQAFISMEHFVNHECIHTDEKLCICYHCGKTFNKSSALKRHIRTHTREKPYNCDECGKSFAQLSHLKTHERVHIVKQDYFYNQSGQSFIDLTSFKRHNEVHTDEKPYICNQCGRAYKSPFSLKQHISRLHTVPEKPFNCDRCKKSFRTVYNLKQHEATKIHADEISTLKPHERVHTGKL